MTYECFRFPNCCMDILPPCSVLFSFPGPNSSIPTFSPYRLNAQCYASSLLLISFLQWSISTFLVSEVAPTFFLYSRLKISSEAKNLRREKTCLKFSLTAV